MNRGRRPWIGGNAAAWIDRLHLAAETVNDPCARRSAIDPWRDNGHRYPAAIVRHRPHAIERTALEDAMNIQYWYLPFAMFTETCDLAECKAPAQSKPNDFVTDGAEGPGTKGADSERA